MAAKVLRMVGAALWAAAKKLIGLAWMAVKVWVAFAVARLTVPEFFYPDSGRVEISVDAAVMAVGAVLALVFLTRDN